MYARVETALNQITIGRTKVVFDAAVTRRGVDSFEVWTWGKPSVNLATAVEMICRDQV